MSENLEETIYFSLPDQEGFLYEYEGELDQVLSDLPEIYNSVEIEEIQGDQQSPVLSSQAAAVIEQLWNYFDRTGERELEGENEYDFQVEGDTLLILPKDTSGEIVAISRDGQVKCTFDVERYAHLMNRFDVASEQMQTDVYKQSKEQNWELG